jgi:hypothetical protein
MRRPTLGHWLSILGVFSACGFSAGQSYGQGPNASASLEARTRFNRGVELYRDGDLAGALAEFRRADALAPAYRLKYNIAQVCEEQHDYACAADALRAYLSGGGREIPEVKRASVELELQKLNASVAQLSVSVDTPGAEILVDDVSFGTAPFTAPLQVNAGRHRVSARKGALVATRSIEVAGGERGELELLLGPTPASLPAKELVGDTQSVPQPAPDRSLAWGAGISAGVLLAGAAVTGIFALHESSQLSSQRNSYPVSGDQLRGTREKLSRLALASDVLGVLAIGCAAGAVYFAVRPVGTASGSGATLSVHGHF